MMEYLQYLLAPVSMALGGGVAWIYTVKYTRKQAEADAMQHFQVAYQGLINDLLTDRTKLREERDEVMGNCEKLARKLSELENGRLRLLEESVEANSRVLRQLADYARAKSLKCTDCVLIELINQQTTNTGKSINQENHNRENEKTDQT